MRTAILGAVMVVSVAALTSCTSESTSGQPGPASSTAGSSAPTSVDVAALDSGDYSTEPRRLAPPATSNDDLLRVESQRMAEFTTLPTEIDPDLTAGSSGGTFLTKRDFYEFFQSDDRPFDALTKDPDSYTLSTGFRGYASDPNSQFPEDTTSLKHGVMFFQTPEKAAEAARVLSESRTKPQKIELDTPFRSISVPTLPGTLVTTGTLANNNGDKSKDKIFLSAITAHGDYVILDEYQFIPAVRNAAIAALSRSLALQKPLIDKFPYTRSRNGKATIVVDQNKILLYTLPNPGSADKLNDSVLGPRGVAFTNADPVGTMQLLTEVGSLHNAVAGSRVFRADTAAGAQKIAAHQTAASTAASSTSDVKPAASPPGLPQATCILVRRQPLCDVTVGRYVGEVSGDDLTDVHRQAVAQYKVLLKADQNAN